MAFEDNQQDQFNMNNSLDQIKQFQSELDKATDAIGAAELQAEEELLGIRLKNLSKTQQTKLAQLGQMLDLEEKSIQELAKLKLTLSNRQFAVRKKEIQKEFQEYKAAAEEFFKAENKRKTSKSKNTSTKNSSAANDLKASNKKAPADVAIQKASRKAHSTEYAVVQVNQEITNAISALQEIAQTATKAAQAEIRPKVEQKPVATTEQGLTQQVAQPVTPKATENDYSDDGLTYNDKVDTGKFGFESITSAIEQLGTLQNTEVSNVVRALESIKKTGEEKGKENLSPTTLDLTSELIKQANLAEETIAKVREFNENKAQNMRIIQIAEEQKLAKEHAQAELDDHEAKSAAYAKKRDLLLNRETYLTEAENKLRTGHILKENELRLNGIAEEAKANDLQNNRAAYEQEARLELENELASNRNRLAEDLIKQEEVLKFKAAHADELRAQEEQKARLDYLKEYQELQAEGFSHLTENMTAEQFAALKAETAATEKAIAARSKISEASEKALATIRGKRTLKEKKQLLEAQVKERATQKDWSKAGEKFQITDNMSEEEKAEVQRRRENATKAEMAVNAAMGALANLAQKLNNQTDKIGEKQAPIDTRLQGSTANEKILGSYWKQLARDMNKIGAVNPYFTQENFASNIETLINKGISFDIKQRAFLMTIQEKIANTFNVADGTLLRLIRIQQQDTTAGRLGMESALNSFLNSMYETSEYLTDVASSVRGSLEEMQALMEGAAGTELEFQVQKWMGSLYSVGMSQEAVQNIARTFGQIASGDVGGLTGNGTGNLLIMAANEAGLSIADILQEGLDAKDTNKLMQAMVNYLAEIAEASSDSRVVQQQFANVFGVRASDLKAATNLASSIKDVSNQDLTYGGMLGQLNKMANSMSLRTSTGEFFSNIWNNAQYTMATQMANDPILYLLPRVATLLEDYAGGIDLPFISAFGTGVDLNTSVAQLMNVAALGGSILGSLGPMISGLGSAVSGSIMLSQAGINTSGKAPVIARGSAPVLQNLGGSSISESGYVGQGDGNAVKEQTLQDADDSSKKQLVEAKDEESTTDISIRANQAVIDMYNLLEEVAHGTQSLRVKIVEDLTRNSGKEPGNWVLSF